MGALKRGRRRRYQTALPAQANHRRSSRWEAAAGCHRKKEVWAWLQVFAAFEQESLPQVFVPEQVWSSVQVSLPQVSIL